MFTAYSLHFYTNTIDTIAARLHKGPPALESQFERLHENPLINILNSLLWEATLLGAALEIPASETATHQKKNCFLLQAFGTWKTVSV